MNVLSASSAPGVLNDRQRTALISLLADEDPSVYQSIRTILIGYGNSAVNWLQPYIHDKDPLLRRRALEVRQSIERLETDNLFLAFCLKNGEDMDLEEASWMLAMTQYPEINVAAYKAILEGYCDELTGRFAQAARGNGLLMAFNQYLFEDLGIAGNADNYFDPENNYLNRVIDRRVGNPLGLCVLYLVLARRLHLPMAGISMPGHFICRFQSPVSEIFIDVFNHGLLMTKTECIKNLVQSGHVFHETYMTPVSPRCMLSRICANLNQTYVDLGDREHAERVQRYIMALGPTHK